jgi:hypothetical protein
MGRAEHAESCFSGSTRKEGSCIIRMDVVDWSNGDRDRDTSAGCGRMRREPVRDRKGDRDPGFDAFTIRGVGGWFEVGDLGLALRLSRLGTEVQEGGESPERAVTCGEHWMGRQAGTHRVPR